MSLFQRRRASGSACSTKGNARRRSHYRPRLLETLESRLMLARDFLESQPLNNTSPGQAVVHFSPSAMSVVDSRSVGAAITNGDNDYYQFTASVAGDIVLSFSNDGGDPSGDLDSIQSLVFEQVTAGGATIGSPVTLSTTGSSGTITIPGVLGGTTYYARVHGSTLSDDANYTLEIANLDREDDGGANNNRIGSATPLGTVGAFAPGVLNDYTVTNGDRDFFGFTIPAGPPQTLNISVVMPAGTGAASGSSGPTNLGLRIRNAVGTIISASPASSTTAVDTAVLNNAAPGTYYLEVYSGSLGQVNRYDLSFVTPNGSLSGYKWDDLNGDGMRQDNEPGLQGVTINLDLGNNGSVDFTDVTDVNGFYDFANVPYGTHKLTETVPLGYTQTWPDVGASFQYVFVVDALSNDFDHLDFGNYKAASVSGSKFNDLDADGAAREVGEGGLANWRFYVDYDNDGVWDNPTEPSALSDVNGDYTINGILAGSYKVREVTQVGWTNSYPATIDGFGRYYSYAFTSGVSFTGADFGNWTTGTVTGTKFEDLDADGIAQEVGEPGVSGFTIYVDYNNNSSLDVGEPSAVTGGGGAYSILGVNPGTWSVREVGQVGWTNSFPATGVHSVTVLSAGTNSGQDFGNWRPATINGTKYNDLNANGVINGGEPGLAGWTFFVDYNNNTSLDVGEPSAVSNGAGAYSITGVTPGTWTVREVGQVGWTNSFPAAGNYNQLFTSNSTTNTRDFANWTTGSVSGTEYNDVNGNGTVPEGGELGLSGWTIYVDYDNDASLDVGEPSATTGAGGGYTITGVNPGNWNLREVATSGWTQTFPVGGNGTPHAITVQSAGSVTGRNFGNFQLAGISGQKFEDVDGDGVKDGGEPGLQGWTIYIDANSSNTLDVGEQSTTTDVNGLYSFVGLPVGTYRIREVQQSGWTQTTTNPAPITLASGQAVSNVDFGNFKLTTISGQKFNDLDGDGVKDGGEPGIPGWQIFIDANSSGAFDVGEPTTFTDGSGNYSFANLGPGNYSIREVPVVGWTQTTTNPAAIPLQSNTPVANVDFGNFENVTISGYKYEDLDADGTSDGGTDPGASGFTIELIRDVNNNGLADDAVTTSFTTLAGGAYSFANFGPGRYFVREQTPLPLGWTQSAPAGNLYTIVASSGLDVTNQDFGNWRAGSISGVKYRDLDGDGTYPTEVGDAPLSGFTIYVDYDADGVLDVGEPSAISAPITGAYTITGVQPGTWKVREVVPPGYSNTYPTTADGFGRYHSVTVVSNTATPGSFDFLNFEIISISGQKYADLSNLGAKDPTEPGLPGWKIDLYRDANNNGVFEPNVYVGGVLVASGLDGDPVYSQLTDTSGNYELGGYGGFTAGTRYFVREVNQQGFQQQSPVGGTYAFVYNNASVTNLNFGNQPCNGDTWNVANGTTTYTAPRVGILTVQLEGPGTVTVTKTLGGNFRYYTGLVSGVGTSAVGATSTGIANPYGAGVRSDLIVDTAGTQYSITVSGAGPNTKLRVINSVNVDVQSTLGLQITTDGCGDFVGVYDDPNFGVTSDAKRILVGAALGNLNNGLVPLQFEGVQYDAQYVNALYNSNPSISKIDVITNGGNDIVRIGDEVTQQAAINLGDGDDLLRAGGGKATGYGGSGNDGMVGGVADDVFYGQNGHDVITGLGGNDRITGDDGNDIISGGAGNETWLKGGNGNDRISGGAGADAIYGEAGTDTVYRDATDVIISTSELIFSVAPPDPVEVLGNELVDNVFNDAYRTDADDDGIADTIDEMVALLIV